MKNWPFFIIIILLFSACGKSTDEEIEDAILSANISLSAGDCQDAITTLEGIGRKNKNAVYLKTLASAYACRAGYSTIEFFTTDIANTASPAPLGGMSKYTLAQETFQVPLENDPKFIDLQTAINLLLYAGGIASTTEPLSTERAKYFSTSELADLNAQLLYLEMVQLGIIFKVYGDASAAGVKGGGAGSSTCLTSYSVLNSAPTLAGACSTINGSHSQTDKTILNDEVTRKRRLCHGVVLMNGVLDLFPNLVTTALPADSQAAATAALTAVNNAKTAAGAIGQVLNTQNQSACENNTIVSMANLEAYYAFLMERSFQ
jgi:hypothetical protein